MNTRGGGVQNLYQPVLVVLSGFIGFIPLMIMPVMVGGYVDYQQLSQKVAGMVCSAQLLGVAIGILVLSRYTLKYGLKKNVLNAAVLVVLIESASLFLDTLPWIFACRFLSGLGAGVVACCTYTWLSSSREPDRGFGLYLLVQFLLGALLLYLVPLGLKLMGVASITLALVFFAILAALFSPAFGNGREGAEQGEGQAQKISFRKILSGEKAVKALFSVGLFELAMSVVWAYAERIGLSWGLVASAISQTLAIATLAGIGGALIVVLLGARLGRGASIFLGVLVIVAVLVTLLFGNQSLLMYGASLLLFNAAWAFTVPYLQAMQAGLGKGAGVVCLGAFVIMASLSLGPALSGVLAEYYGLFGVVLTSISLLGLCVYCAQSTIAFQSRKLQKT